MTGSRAIAIEQGAYRALTEACGLIDRSERGKLALTGSDAVEFLNGQVTNELAQLSAGEGCYAAFLTHKGKMLGDLRILAVGEADGRAQLELLLDTERVALQALFDMINRFKLGYDVRLGKRTLECSLLSLVGPMAAEVLARAAEDTGDAQALAADEHAHRPAGIAGCTARLIRTAEPAGVDVLCEASDREAVWAALARAGARPVGDECGEILRVEDGRPRYGVDLDDSVIPQEAGLNARAVSFTKGCYVGQETVARLYYKGRPNRHLRGLRLSEPVDSGAQLRWEERPVGSVGSSVISPAHGPIALALVRREVEPGAVVRAGEHSATATVTELPFTPAPAGAAAGRYRSPV